MLSSDPIMHGGHRPGRDRPIIRTPLPERPPSPGMYNHMSQAEHAIQVTRGQPLHWP